jgi:hypothetical protein
MIDYDVFYNWADKKFDSIKTHGDEIKLNSPYDPDKNDTKHKLWCRPDGMTKKGEREHGCFQCWISGTKGTLIRLVMDVENCSYDEACDILDVHDPDYDKELEAFFAAKKTETLLVTEVPQTKKALTFPEGVVPIESLPSWNYLRKNAEKYLLGRGIPLEGLYVGTKNEFRERIVIPYYDKDGELVYYNGRYFGDSSKPAKYRGPDKEIGIGKGDVLFMPKWVEPGSILHVTEGEFDAMVLNLCGLNSCSVGGSNLTTVQQKILRQYNICLCGDIDKPGAGAVFRAGTKMLEEGFKNVKFVRPPKGYKDWNDLYIQFGILVGRYVESHLKPFDLITAEQLFAENV